MMHDVAGRRMASTFYAFQFFALVPIKNDVFIAIALARLRFR